jgi:two-component system, NtrC family, sensor kinase
VNPSEAPLPLRKSLRAKAWLVTFGLLAYLLGAGLYVATQRAKLLDSVAALQQLSVHEKTLALTEAAVNGALIDVSESSNAAQSDPGPVNDMRLYMESCAKLFADLERHDPTYALLQRGIQRGYEQLQATPVRASWIELREALKRAADDLEIRHQRLNDQREALTVGYQRQYDAVTVESLVLAIVGLVAFGSLAAWFFAGLAHDIRRAQDHALHIVQGRRGAPLQVQREDELGRLMHAVNHMSDELDEREQQIQLDIHQRSHQDKMLAVGALAAGVAHEVNNPLMVISGLAQELQGADGASVAQTAQQILAQVQRASQSARQLAQLAAPQPAELDWVDINELLRQAARLIAYDRRYRHLVFDLQLDPVLPAVRTSAGAIQQVLMQILSLACAAVAGTAGAAARLQIISLPDREGITVQVLLPPVLDFGRSDTQRHLLLCRAIVEPLRGRLALGQVPGPLQRIKLQLPADPGGDER